MGCCQSETDVVHPELTQKPIAMQNTPFVGNPSGKLVMDSTEVSGDEKESSSINLVLQ